ncbi:CU044_2847 family protein [Nocardiopsis sp. M1B1]|uniref:CU044_2847 family protein n=1 Tax=Nocardiopsis sp. M1B1 TaxID=3450454 RepID=UPI00403A2DA2
MIDFVTDDDVIISIETTPVRRDGASDVSLQVDPAEKIPLEKLVLRIEKVAEAVSGQLAKLSASGLGPSETEIEFGVSVSTEANVMVAKGSGQATFKVRMVWNRDRG